MKNKWPSLGSQEQGKLRQLRALHGK